MKLPALSSQQQYKKVPESFSVSGHIIFRFDLSGNAIRVKRVNLYESFHDKGYAGSEKELRKSLR